MNRPAASATPAPDPNIAVTLDELLAQRLRVPASVRTAPSLARAPMAGAHAGRTRGRGMDYVESRAYEPGDDMRQIDWRVTARTGRMHTKLFQEERERIFMVLGDTHASLQFGTRVRFKSVQAARAQALATWLAVRAGERVGAVAFGAVQHAMKPRGGQRGALALAGAWVDWDRQVRAQSAPAREPLSAALARAATLMRGAGQVLLVTDGQCVDDDARAHLLQLRRRADVSVLIVADALELAAPPAGRYPVEVGGLRRLLDLRGAAQRQHFHEQLGQGVAHITALCRALGLRHRIIDTAVDPLDAVLALRSGRGEVAA
ncbi:DUF58 domain-containing protein [Oleiagrimonas sp. C23AA]|uniref:DUF58 domain-containing protein n=1 Tax=Oleiagrimonas sp. C23AA TaxID=2719047 RepID=UPI0031B684BA